MMMMRTAALSCDRSGTILLSLETIYIFCTIPFGGAKQHTNNKLMRSTRVALAASSSVYAICASKADMFQCVLFSVESFYQASFRCDRDKKRDTCTHAITTIEFCFARRIVVYRLDGI